jgi:hypothetical protein
MSSSPVVWLSTDSSLAEVTNSASPDMSVGSLICKESRYMIKVSPLARGLYQLIDLQCDSEHYSSEASSVSLAQPTTLRHSYSTGLDLKFPRLFQLVLLTK